MADNDITVPVTPDQAWGMMDRLLIMSRVHEIADEMQGQLAKAKAEAQFEGLQKRNGAFYPSERIRREEAGADQWARRLYEAALDVWRIQGYEPSQAFFLAIYGKLLVPLFAARTSAVSFDMRTANLCTGGSIPQINAVLESYSAAMTRLQQKWKTRMEVAGREREYATLIAERGSAPKLPPNTIPVVEANNQGNQRTITLKRKLTNSQKRRRDSILGAVQLRLTGVKYCRHLDERKIRPLEQWLENGCPASYSAAYRDPVWRVKIQNEKANYAKRYLRSPSRESES